MRLKQRRIFTVIKGRNHVGLPPDSNCCQTATAELEETAQNASQVLREYDQLMGWAEMYDNCTFEAKKMIVAQFVKAVHVRRDYEIDIEFNVSFEQFQALYLEGEPEGARKPGTDTVLAIETKK